MLFKHKILHPPARWTSGFITPTLLANLIFLIVVVGIVVMLKGRLSPRHLGVRIRDVPGAIAWTAGIWVVTLIVVTIALWAGDETLTFNPKWSTQPWFSGGVSSASCSATPSTKRCSSARS